MHFQPFTNDHFHFLIESLLSPCNDLTHFFRIFISAARNWANGNAQNPQLNFGHIRKSEYHSKACFLPKAPSSRKVKTELGANFLPVTVRHITGLPGSQKALNTNINVSCTSTQSPLTATLTTPTHDKSTERNVATHSCFMSV